VNSEANEVVARISDDEWRNILHNLERHALSVSRRLRWRTRNPVQLPGGETVDSIVSKAIEKVLSGDREWNPQKEPDITKYLCGVIDSLLNHLAESQDNVLVAGPPKRESPDYPAWESGSRNHDPGADWLARHNPSPEDILLQQEQKALEDRAVESLLDKCGDDPVLMAREIEFRRLRLGVVMLHDCELPELLRTRQYIDARQGSDKAIAAVLDWLNGRRDLGRLAGNYAPVILEDYPKDDFVGRANYLAQLRSVFSEGPVRFLLHGEPGAGKSTLALRFAWEAQKDFDAVVFQRCGQRSVGEIAGELAHKLRSQLGEQVLRLPPQEKLEAAAEWLCARQSLLVLDDVWSVDVKQVEPGGACSVLHTSCQQSLPWISAGHTSEVDAKLTILVGRILR